MRLLKLSVMLFLSFLLLWSGLQNTALEQVDSKSQERDDSTESSITYLRKTSESQIKKNKVDNQSDTLSYTVTKKQIDLLRGRLRNDLNDNRIDIDSVKRTFSDQLMHQLIPYWYGTPWSFGGHTSTPRKGKIACGYFVSTTLKDMGLKLNRFTLAQKSPIDEAKAISCGTEIKTISDNDSNQALVAINKFVQEGIYFIGFDTGHVGFLMKQNNTLYLVHSNYLSPISVCIEPLATARVFKNFTKFHLVDISHNEKLIRKWLNNEVLF
ncbi:hypothetical protein LCGC14_1216070 [marine sediment metagenome]|uniref:NlpC/P60 family protein n=2 Tax=root TaxID=1 RepID=A0A831QKQ0_9FLAO|nr:hypothetical protein [Pricia sp.]HEA20165.1 hypothetical protein [Pricia antarctica]